MSYEEQHTRYLASQSYVHFFLGSSTDTTMSLMSIMLLANARNGLKNQICLRSAKEAAGTAMKQNEARITTNSGWCQTFLWACSTLGRSHALRGGGDSG
jgi:hypothetical protein